MAERQREGNEDRRRKVSVPKLRTILKQIGDELSTEELAKLIFLAADHIPKSKTQGMNSLKFFSALEELQLIDTKQDDVDYLIDLLNNLPRVDLVKKLKCNQSVVSNFTEKVVIVEKCSKSVCTDFTDAVLVTNTIDINETTSSIIKREEVNNGGFVQDPDLMESIFQKHDDTVSALEEELSQVSTTNTELKKKNHELEFQINQMKDDQSNLMRERNSALGMKSEYVFRESELRKELSDLKRMNSLLEKNGTKANTTIEAQEKEIEQLKLSLEEKDNTTNELKAKIEMLEQEKLAVQEQLAKVQKSDEGNGRVKCKRCGLVYVEANNTADACRYHSGHFESVGSIKKRTEWSCCKNTNKNAPGCCKKKHLTIDYQLSPSVCDQSRKFTM